MRPLPPLVRPWPYALAGLGVGFLFLTEFALDGFLVVQAALLVLALAGLAGALRRWTALEMWPLFIAAAILPPLIATSHVVGLPRCDAVAAGVACFGGTRDVGTQFAMDAAILVMSLAGVVVLIAREMLETGRAARDN